MAGLVEAPWVTDWLSAHKFGYEHDRMAYVLGRKAAGVYDGVRFPSPGERLRIAEEGMVATV